jgi:hypothetical protein
MRHGDELGYEICLDELKGRGETGVREANARLEEEFRNLWLARSRHNALRRSGWRMHDAMDPSDEGVAA